MFLKKRKKRKSNVFFFPSIFENKKVKKKKKTFVRLVRVSFFFCYMGLRHNTTMFRTLQKNCFY